MSTFSGSSFWDNNRKALNMNQIKKMLPLDLGILLTQYIDPFVGSGQMFLEVMANYGMDDAVICDTNPELINAYKQTKHNPNALIEALLEYENQFNQGCWRERYNFYRMMQGKYNYIKGNESTSMRIKRAALFIFLTETCKIFRNTSDNIIVPDYIPEPMVICREEALRKVSGYLQSTKIIGGDFKECLPYVNKQTFLFINPPPINSKVLSANANSGSTSSFSAKDMKVLESFCKISYYLGAEVFINPSCKNITYKKETRKGNK